MRIPKFAVTALVSTFAACGTSSIGPSGPNAEQNSGAPSSDSGSSSEVTVNEDASLGENDSASSQGGGTTPIIDAPSGIPDASANSGADATSSAPRTSGSDASSGTDATADAASTKDATSTNDAASTGNATPEASTTPDATTTCTGSTNLTGTGNMTATVSVEFGTTKSTMSSLGIGIDTAVYDELLISSAVATSLKAGNVQALRYPGGSYADIFNWQTTTVNGGSYVDTADTFDSFMNTLILPVGIKPIITVNYGSNTTNSGPADPSEAAAWVTYANITNKWGITYWEIGNENVGNGYYENEDWEYDLHYLNQTAANRVGQSVLTPLAYGTNSVAFINAMKAVDSTIKCGVYQLAPDIYPNTANPPYNAQVLQGVGDVIDFVIIHWYPCGMDVPTCLQSPLLIPAIVSGEQSELTAALPARASQIELLITESGAGSVTGPATALFAADEYASWFENGVVNVEYQELHNGFLTSGDTGIADSSPEGPYYGAKMAGILAAAGDTFVSATSASTLIGVHAVKKANGGYAIMLVNRDPSNSYSVTVSISGATFGNCGTRYDFGQGNFNGTYPSSGVAQSSVSGFKPSSFTITVPAYTISVVENPG